MTYILQGLSILLMIAALATGHRAILEGSAILVFANGALFCANLGLFIWQGRIRAKQRRWRQ